MEIMENFKCPKHTIIDGLAYTEDSILVYNIFIQNLPKGATKENVTEYFRKHGEVLNVGLLEVGRAKHCFVNFADSKVASKVLQRADNILLNRPLVVQPSYSWYQPSGQRILELLSENFKNDSIADNACSIASSLPQLEQNALIFTLNDDCLEHICKKLKLNDQLNFALTCQRFCEIFKMISHIKYANLSTEIFSNLSLFKIKVFLHIVGPKIKGLFIDFIYAMRSSNTELKVLKFLGKFCTNVEKLKIDACNLDPNKIRTLLSQMPLLRELELNNVDISVTFIKFLKTLKNLKCLMIKDNADVTGKNINFLSALQKLSFNGCQNIAPWHFKKICKNLKKLKYLDITYCDQLKTEDFEHIPKYLLKLETLKFSTSSQNFNCITRLPKLKHLEVKDYHHIYMQIEFFRDLAQHHADTLQELKLVDLACFNKEMATLVADLKNLKRLHCNGYGVDDESLKKFSQINGLEQLSVPKCNDISDKGVVQLLERAVKLKRLNLSSCPALTPDLIRNVFKLLLDQRARYLRTERLQITLTALDGFKCVINEIDLGKYSNVLKITLEKIKNLYYSYEDDEDYIDEYDADDIDYPFYDYDYFYGDELSEEDAVHNFLEHVLLFRYGEDPFQLL